MLEPAACSNSRFYWQASLLVSAMIVGCLVGWHCRLLDWRSRLLPLKRQKKICQVVEANFQST